MKNISQDHNNLPSYILLLFCLFVLIFFTKDLATGMYWKIQEKKTLELQQQESREQWEEFSILKKSLESWEWENIVELQKYAKQFSQEGFIEFIYDYIEESDKQWSSSLIKSINFSEPSENEIGFTEVNVNLTVKVSNLATMWQLLRYLISPEAEYKIFITHFDFPNETDAGSFLVDIPLKIFYK